MAMKIVLAVLSHHGGWCTDEERAQWAGDSMKRAFFPLDGVLSYINMTSPASPIVMHKIPWTEGWLILPPYGWTSPSVCPLLLNMWCNCVLQHEAHTGQRKNFNSLWLPFIKSLFSVSGKTLNFYLSALSWAVIWMQLIKPTVDKGAVKEGSVCALEEGNDLAEYSILCWQRAEE